MTPNVAAEHSSAQDFDHRAASVDDRIAHCGILGALIEALNAPETYRIVHCGGELFLEPAVQF